VTSNSIVAMKSGCSPNSFAGRAAEAGAAAGPAVQCEAGDVRVRKEKIFHIGRLSAEPNAAKHPS